MCLALIQKAWAWSSFYGNLGWAQNIILQILFSWPVHFTLRNLKIQFQRKGWCFPQHKPTRAAFNSLSRFHFLLWRWLLLKTNKAWITLNADPRKIKLLTICIFFFHLRKVEKKKPSSWGVYIVVRWILLSVTQNNASFFLNPRQEIQIGFRWNTKGCTYQGHGEN